MKKMLASALIALGMVIGVGVPMAFAAKTYGGITYDAKEPIRITTGGVTGTASVQGTATVSGQIAVAVNRYSGGTWRVIASRYYDLFKGSYYNTTISVTGTCYSGTSTYRTSVKFHGGLIDNSAGKNFTC